MYVVFECFVFEFWVWIDLGNQEDGEFLLGQLVDYGVFFVQVENVEFVDLGWCDQEWVFFDCVCGGCVLDQFDNVVFENNFIGCCGQVFVNFEVFYIGLGQGEVIVFFFQVGY